MFPFLLSHLLVPSACPAVEKPTQGVADVAPSCSIYSDTVVDDAAFRDFQSILLGYSDVFLKSKVLNILKEKEISLKQFEEDSAWNWYRRYWSNLLVCLSDIPQFDSDTQELRLHALREQWLKDLYRRAYSQKSTDDN